MAAAPFEKNATDSERKPPEVENKKAPERVKKLTFGQRMVLAAGIITLGGIPAALMTLGSVPERRPQTQSQNGAAVMSNTTPQFEACTVPAPKNDFKPTMNAQNR